MHEPSLMARQSDTVSTHRDESLLSPRNSSLWAKAKLLDLSGRLAMGLPNLPRRSSTGPEFIQMDSVTQRVHRLPEAFVTERPELIPLG
jgi:hypothetical protein